MLSRLGTIRTIEGLIELLSCTTPKHIRGYAIVTLANLGDLREVHLLLRIVKTDHDQYVHETAIVALGKLRTLGDARAVEPLLRALEDAGSWENKVVEFYDVLARFALDLRASNWRLDQFTQAIDVTHAVHSRT